MKWRQDILMPIGKSGARKRNTILDKSKGLIFDITATEDNLNGISQFLQKAGAAACALLPYNPLWLDKAVKNGIDISYSNPEFMSQRQEENCFQFLAVNPELQ